MPIFNNDLINSLIKITPESNLTTVREERLSATENTQLAFTTIFSTPSVLLTQDVKYEFAHLVAQQTGSLVLAHFYKALIKESSNDLNTAALLAAKNYLQVLVHSPKKTHYELIQSLTEQGWNEADIILLAQLITFVTYQARLVEGLLLLQGVDTQPPSSLTAPITAGHWNINAQTHQGLPAPTAFTQDQLGWASWLKAREQQTLSSDEALVMKKFGQLNSEYFLLLAHQSKILEIRTLIDRGIFIPPVDYRAGNVNLLPL
ncbi:hypothetical protein [Providencia sneebia]|uniref:hypothetical protein n=1 Tax=Providencia sneebia TaxID=516075 RepID=UPI0002DB84FF|nr:hypothetical protein [Providencia sneebia]